MAVFFRGFPSFEMTCIVGADHDDAEFGVRLRRDAGIRDAVNQVGGLIPGNAEVAGMIGANAFSHIGFPSLFQ